MITTQNIYKAIRTRLTADLPTITTQIKDVKNPTPPCLYIQYISVNENEVASDTINTITSFAIVYFSDKKTLLDLLQVEQKLRKSFRKPLKIEYTEDNTTKQRFVLIDAVTSDLNETDYILTVTLDFNFYQNSDIENPFDDYDNIELMQVLEGV